MLGESRRVVLARGARVAIAEWLDADGERVKDGGDGAFEVDPDPRPMPYAMPVHRALVLSSDETELLGGVSWHAVNYGGHYNCVAWNIGGSLLPHVRGRGAGTDMWRVVALHLLATTDIDRIEASTDVTNLPTQRSLEKAGFTREGILRGAQMREGVRRDLVSYSLLRTDVTDEKLTAGQNGSAELASGDG